MKHPDTAVPEFDPDLDREHHTNREAARVRKLRWDSSKRAYVDVDGCPRRDRFGQTL